MGTIYYPVRRRPARSSVNLLEQIILAVLAGFLIFGLAMLGTFAATRLWYAGRIFPGVNVGAAMVADVGGLSPRAASALLAQRITYAQEWEDHPAGRRTNLGGLSRRTGPGTRPGSLGAGGIPDGSATARCPRR